MLIEVGVVILGEESWHIEMDKFTKADVPSTLAGVLQARLDGLPVQQRTILQQASVVGRLFWDRIVAYIQEEARDGGDPQLVLLALNSLRSRELIYRHEESAFVGSVEYLFKHDVLREVTYESVLKRLRKTYHSLVADWLIANCGDRIAEYSGLIAEHLLTAQRSKHACEYFTRAGDAALASYANSEAEGYYRQALELLPSVQIHAKLLSGLGEALFRQGQSQEAKQIWQSAIDLYEELGDSNKLGETYTRLSKLLWLNYGSQKAWDLCQEGLKELDGEPDSLGYAHLLAEGCRTAYFSDVYDKVIPLYQRAIEMAERVKSLEVQIEASTTMAIYKGDEEESIVNLKELAERAESNDLMDSAARAHNNIGVLLDDNIVDLNSCLRHQLRAVAIYKQIGNIENMMFILANIYEDYISLGELNTVEMTIRELIQSSTVPRTRLDEFLHLNRPFLMTARGEWLSSLEANTIILQDLKDNGDNLRLVNGRYSVANCILEMNRFGHSVELSEAEKSLLENIEQQVSAWNSLLTLVIVYIRQGRLAYARDHYEQANKSFSHLHNWISYTKKIRSKIKFELALAEQRWGEAIINCESSIKTYQRGGHRWDWARVLIDLGDALLGRNETGDLERARETYQQSLDMFTEMGAPGYIKVLEERLRSNH